jgi:hypothetical protein
MGRSAYLVGVTVPGERLPQKSSATARVRLSAAAGSDTTAATRPAARSGALLELRSRAPHGAAGPSLRSADSVPPLIARNRPG